MVRGYWRQPEEGGEGRGGALQDGEVSKFKFPVAMT
jgi:hypothetical protein